MCVVCVLCVCVLCLGEVLVLEQRSGGSIGRQHTDSYSGVIRGYLFWCWSAGPAPSP